MNKALSTAEDGERIQPAVAVIVLVFITIVFLDGDADVVGHEANGEGVEEGFEERETAGDDAVVGVDYGDEFSVEGRSGWLGQDRQGGLW